MNYVPITMPIFGHETGKVDIAVAIDMSGSMSNNLKNVIRETMNQLVSALAEKGYFKIMFWAFDNAVCYESIQVINNHNLIELDKKLDILLSCGGGGSSIIESFHLVYALGLNPTDLIFITDGFVMCDGKLFHKEHVKNHVILLKEETFKDTIKLPFEHELHVLNYSENAEEIA